MKYISKIPEGDINLKEEMINKGWKMLKEPKNLLIATLISLPISILNIYLCILFMKWINKDLVTVTNSIIHGGSISFTIKFRYIIYIYLYILLHEIVHLIFIPNFTKSKSTFISVKLWGGFVYTEETIKKSRYLVITILPFIMLSFVLPFIMTLMGFDPIIILTLSIINSAGSSVDVLSFILLLLQIPKNGVIKNNGMSTFYLSNQ